MFVSPWLTETGTFCYIDPEYQQTGMLGVKSDLYSFGVVLLQIITAMPAIGLGRKVEMAIENNKLREILDPTVSEWPEEETLELAKLALQCCELRKKDRPDLASVLFPALNRLKEFATENHEYSQDKTLHVSHANNSFRLPPIPSSQVNFLKPFFLRDINYKLNFRKLQTVRTCNKRFIILFIRYIDYS